MSGSPEKAMRRVVEECADCDICRFLMDESCRMFPELYRLWDREKETGVSISAKELRRLADLCNFCALCPCPPVRAGILRAKARFIERDGLPRRLRLMEDVALTGRICGVWPQLANAVLQRPALQNMAKGALGIHRKRQLPPFPRESFWAWAKKHGLDHPPLNTDRPKAAYFAGCTAGYLYPRVARAAVTLLRSAGIAVWVPPQACCGMPPLLEGDSRLAERLAQKTVDGLARAVEKGFAIVCSCPTCGYVLRKVIREGAIQAGDGVAGKGKAALFSGNRSEGIGPVFGEPFGDKGVFAGIDPHKRILVAENTRDLGFYLAEHTAVRKTPLAFGPLKKRAVYYPPCHLREQKIGQPYATLLKNVPGLDLEIIDGDLYCCGMGGIMGFKKGFHEASIRMGAPLMERIESLNPEILVTDCLSCRLQFHQMTRRTIRHPLELLATACGGIHDAVETSVSPMTESGAPPSAQPASSP